MYTKLQPIKPYVAPQFLVEPVGEPLATEDDIADELEAMEFGYSGPVIVDLNIQGWGEYDRIIRTTDEHGESRYYLAY